MQNTNIALPMDAAQIVQQMLSRKRLLASQPLDFASQGPQQNGVSSSDAAEPATGVLGQSMAAAFFGEAGLTEHELALVSDAVQQVLEEHEASPAPSKLSAAAAQHMEVIQLPVQQQASPRAQSLPVAALQHSPQHQQVYRSAGARSGTGADPAVQQGAPAGNARHSRLSAIMAAEKELEQQLMQLNNMQARKAELLAAAASASPPAAAPASPTPAAAAQQHRAANSEVRSVGGAVDSADITAEMLSAALEDPNASVDDIVGILSFVLSQNKVVKGGTPAAGPQANFSAADQQTAFHQQQQDADPAAATDGYASRAAGAGCSMQGTSDSNIMRTSQSAGEMAARLLQNARAVHGLESNSTEQAAAAYGGNMAQQAARDSMSAWQSEGGLMYNRGLTAPAAAGTAALWGGMAAAAAEGTPGSSSRHTGPRGDQHQLSVIDRLYGAHADKAAAQREAGHASEGSAWMTPAETEKAWRLGLRSKADGQPASRVHPGVIGSEVQEWLAYDGMSPPDQYQHGGATKPDQTPQLDAKLQQLYERNVDWKRRCEVVYAQQRSKEEREELKPCTFVPTINQKSVKMVQKFRHGQYGRPSSALSALKGPADQQRPHSQRSASTGRLNDSRDRHERYVSEEQRIVEQSKRAAQESAIRAAKAVAAVLGEEAGRQLMEEMLGKDLVQKLTVADDPVDSADGAAALGRRDSGEFESDGAPAPQDGSNSPHPAWAISDAALRLYVDAFERKDRAEQAAHKAEAVRSSRPRSVPRTTTYRHVEPKVYELPKSDPKLSGPRSPSKAGRGTLPSACTFKPQTNTRIGKFPSSSRTNQQQSPPAPVRSLDTSKSNNASRKLDKEFFSALEHVEHEHQEHNVGLRQLISSAGTNANPNMLSPRTPGSTSVAGCSAGGGRSNAGGRSSAAGSAAAASVAAAAAAVAPRSRSAPRGSWWGDDLNWNEFIERQGLFLLMKDANTAKVAAQMSRVKKPQLSPGSKRILKEKQKASQSAQQSLRSSIGSDPYQHCTQYPARLLYGSADDATATSPAAAAAASSSPTGSSSAGSPYLDRVQQQLQSSQQLPSPPGGSQQQQQQLPDWATYSFKPSITRKASAREARSFEDMSEGDRLRKEAKLEQLRIMEEARRLAGVTFSPDMSPTRSRRTLSRSSGDLGDHNGGNISRPDTADSASNRFPNKSYESVKAKIQFKGPGLDAYMQSLEEKRQALEKKRKELEEKRQEAEMAECTFKPTTTPVPAYLAAMQNMGYTARFIETKMAEVAGMTPLQQQQQSPQQAHRAKMMHLEQQHRDMVAQQQQIVQQHRAGMMQQQHHQHQQRN